MLTRLTVTASAVPASGRTIALISPLIVITKGAGRISEVAARFVLDAAIQVQERSRLDRDLAERLGERISDEIRDNPVVRIPSHVVLLGRVVGLLSGVIRSLESRVDLVQTVLPYAFGAAGR